MTTSGRAATARRAPPLVTSATVSPLGQASGVSDGRARCRTRSRTRSTARTTSRRLTWQGEVAPSTLAMPPRFHLGHAHAPHRSACKTRMAILMELGGRVATSGKVLAIVTEAETNVMTMAESKENAKKRAKVVSEEELGTRNAARAVRIALLELASPLRQILIQLDRQVDDQRRLSRTDLLHVAKHLDADYSVNSNRDTLVRACLDALPNGDFDEFDRVIGDECCRRPATYRFNPPPRSILTCSDETQMLRARGARSVESEKYWPGWAG